MSVSVIIGSTFLWFTAQQELENVFDMDGFEVVITENFDPNTPVVPDTQITKEVGAENKSRVDVAVRVQLKESPAAAEAGRQGQSPCGLQGHRRPCRR